MTTPPATTRSNVRLWFGIAALIAVVTAGIIFGYQQWNARHDRGYHRATVKDGVLYRDGVRSSDEFKRTVAEFHPKTVVCLVEEAEIADPAKPQFKQEFDFLQQQGVRVERIPVKLGGLPTSDDVQRFLTVTAKPENQPVLVHCAQGVRRTGMMVAAFQMSSLGYDRARAKAEIMTFGHSDNTVDDIRRFIDAYDAKNRTVSQESPEKK